MNEAYLCLGGNLGNCAETFGKGLELLVSMKTVVRSKSSIYKSEAWGMENAPDFFNQLVHVRTELGPHELLKVLLDIESQLGRKRSEGNGYESRIIDIDIIFYGSAVIEEPGLHIPHPRMHLRRFVLEPLCEIAPNVVHPVFKKTVHELLEECPDKTEIKKIAHAV